MANAGLYKKSGEVEEPSCSFFFPLKPKKTILKSVLEVLLEVLEVVLEALDLSWTCPDPVLKLS